MNTLRWLPLLGAILILAGCSTVESRIKERPEAYNNLPEKQKELVLRGEVTEGMSTGAAYLAWGSPDTVVRGSDHGRSTEEWIYEATRTQVVSDYRPAPYIYGSHGVLYRGWDYVFDPIVISQSYPYKSVLFEKGKAVAWRRAPLR